MHMDPLSVGIVSSKLQEYGYETRYQPMNPNKVEGLNEQIEWADEIFISARHFDTTPTQEVITAANRLGKRTIVGGYGPTFNSEAFANASVRVYGEAEPILDILIDNLRSDRGEVEYDTRDLPPFDLSKYIHPDRAIYSSPKIGPRLHAFETQRGCPNACSFCSPTRLQKRGKEGIRVRPVDDLIREIETAGLQKGHNIFFVDLNTMSIPNQQLEELFSWLKVRGIRWYTEGTVAKLVEDTETASNLLKLMSPLDGQGGCCEFLYGADDLAVEKTKGSKNKRRSMITKTVKIFKEHGIALNLSVVVGLDHHRFPETFYQIAGQINEAQPAYTFFHIATPYQGTPWGDQVYKAGRVIEADSTKFNHQQAVAHPKSMTREELEQGYIWLKRQFNNPIKILGTAQKHFNPKAMRQDPFLLGPMLTGLPWAAETWLGLQELGAKGYIDRQTQRELDQGYRNWQ
jgi:radical SAM superfamily enzyme YgiQ (UPF0313 family)